jgi:DNA-binding MarR family transcriptional regulator
LLEIYNAYKDAYTSKSGESRVDQTKRQITKIGREVNRLINLSLKGSGVGTAEYEFLHAVRKNPGITQAAMRSLLGLDKGAAARRAANLEAKGFITRQPNPDDGRSQLLYATAKADSLKASRAVLEARFYEWLLADLSDEARTVFADTLDRIYTKCKTESKAGFPDVTRYIAESGPLVISEKEG